MTADVKKQTLEIKESCILSCISQTEIDPALAFMPLQNGLSLFDWNYQRLEQCLSIFPNCSVFAEDKLLRQAWKNKKIPLLQPGQLNDFELNDSVFLSFYHPFMTLPAILAILEHATGYKKLQTLKKAGYHPSQAFVPRQGCMDFRWQKEEPYAKTLGQQNYYEKSDALTSFHPEADKDFAHAILSDILAFEVRSSEDLKLLGLTLHYKPQLLENLEKSIEIAA